MQKTLYVGLDVHKVSISVTAAEGGGPEGAVSFMGTIPSTLTDAAKPAKRLAIESRR